MGPCQTLQYYLKKKLTRNYMYVYNKKRTPKFDRIKLRVKVLLCLVLKMSREGAF